MSGPTVATGIGLVNVGRQSSGGLRALETPIKENAAWGEATVDGLVFLA